MSKQIIYFDTNVLLGLYQYPNSVTAAIIEVLANHYDEEVVIPWRTTFEYFKCREGIIKKANKVNVLTIAKKELDEAFGDILEKIDSMLKLKNIDAFNTSFKKETENVKDCLLKAKSKTYKELDESIDEYDINYESSDPVLTFVNKHKSLLNPTLNEQMDLATRYWARKSLSFPPGLSDSKKDLDPTDPFRPCGDYFIWQEVLTNNTKACKVIFVTAENKKDYWEEKGGNAFSRLLLNEFIDINPKTVFEPLHFSLFLEKYIVPFLTDDLDTIGFLEKNKTIMDSIFIDKDFIDLCFDGVYEMENSILDDYIGESLVCGNITDFYDINIEDIEIISDKDDIYLFYEPEHGTIVAQFSLRITGSSNVRELLYHDEGEDIDEYHPNASFDIEARVEAIYKFDGKIVLFDSFENFTHTSHSIEANDVPDDDIFEDDESYNN